MLLRLLIVSSLLGGLALLPCPLPRHRLMQIAGALWASGGLWLILLGSHRLATADLSPLPLTLTAAGALILGAAKGWFILRRTAHRNIARLQALPGPHPPRHIYSTRSWLIIVLMWGLSAAVAASGLPLGVRGFVTLTVGVALGLSSVAYGVRPGGAQ